MNVSWVQVFEGFWVGDRSREVARESFSWIALIDFMFFVGCGDGLL